MVHKEKDTCQMQAPSTKMLTILELSREVEIDDSKESPYHACLTFLPESLTEGYWTGESKHVLAPAQIP